jgi:hypothetical protein
MSYEDDVRADLSPNTAEDDIMERAVSEEAIMKDCQRYASRDKGGVIVPPDKEGNGGRTPIQYDLPKNAEQLQDLIEYRNMNFAQGEIFKSLYRGETCTHSTALREARKQVWYAQREVARLTPEK